MTTAVRFPLAASLLVAVLAAGCASPHDINVGTVPDDYRTRHPIVVTESTRDLDILVASSDTRLTLADQTRVEEFAARFRTARASVIRIQVPEGGRNGPAADLVARSAMRVLRERGVPATRVLVSPYRPQIPGEASPIRLSFNAVTAQVEPCGRWPEDLGDTYQNRNYHNFGCATQTNLAAQISDPRDLLGPRGMSEIDAERRTDVIEKYRTGRRTGAQAPTQQSNYDW